MSLRVYLLFCKYYREVVLLFSIQKIKEAEFFNELTQSLRVYFFKISIEKCLLICSRYKKFKKAQFFNEQT